MMPGTWWPSSPAKRGLREGLMEGESSVSAGVQLMRVLDGWIPSGKRARQVRITMTFSLQIQEIYL